MKINSEKKKTGISKLPEGYVREILNYWRDWVVFTIFRKKYGGIQLKVPELLRIVNAIRNYEDCRLLVFGMGYDSPFWSRINSHGSTLFLEDYEPWFDKISLKYPDLEAYLVSYPCNMTQWQEVIDQPDRLTILLPEKFENAKFDVILVDGPRGHRVTEDQPGRMSSIFMASRLVGPNGYVFVHDAEREVERTYSSKYLGEDRLVEEIRGRALLRVFHFPG